MNIQAQQHCILNEIFPAASWHVARLICSLVQCYLGTEYLDAGLCAFSDQTYMHHAIYWIVVWLYLCLQSLCSAAREIWRFLFATLVDASSSGFLLHSTFLSTIFLWIPCVLISSAEDTFVF